MPVPTPNPNRPCLYKARHGVCRFGSSCAFVDSHSWDAKKLRNASICHSFRNHGKCTRGDSCTFLHIEAPPDPCWQFMATGRCNRGAACRYSHSKSSKSSWTHPTEESRGTGMKKEPRNGRESRSESERDYEWRKDKDIPKWRSRKGDSKSHYGSSNKSNAREWKGRVESPPHIPPTPPPPPPRQVSLDSSLGTQAYQKGDYQQAVRSFTHALSGYDVQHAERISLLSNRAHSYHKLYEADRGKDNLDATLKDCTKAIDLAGSSGHFKCYILASKVYLYRLDFDKAMKLAKLAHGRACGEAAKLTTVLDLIDRITSERIAERKKRDLEEKRVKEEQERCRAEAKHVEKLLRRFASMTAYQILGLTSGATKSEIRNAYRKAALKYHPDKQGGDKALFQKISEAYEEIIAT